MDKQTKNRVEQETIRDPQDDIACLLGKVGTYAMFKEPDCVTDSLLYAFCYRIHELVKLDVSTELVADAESAMSQCVVLLGDKTLRDLYLDYALYCRMKNQLVKGALQIELDSTLRALRKEQRMRSKRNAEPNFMSEVEKEKDCLSESTRKQCRTM